MIDECPGALRGQRRLTLNAGGIERSTDVAACAEHDRDTTVGIRNVVSRPVVADVYRFPGVFGQIPA